MESPKKSVRLEVENHALATLSLTDHENGRSPSPPELLISHDTSVPRTSTLQAHNTSKLVKKATFNSQQKQEPVIDLVPWDELLMDRDNEDQDREVTQRTKDKLSARLNKAQTMTVQSHDLEIEEDEDMENEEILAIPEYGSEGINEDDEEYGTSQEEDNNSDQQRMKEIIEELQIATQNIKEEQLDEGIRNKLSKLIDDVRDMKERFP